MFLQCLFEFFVASGIGKQGGFVGLAGLSGFLCRDLMVSQHQSQAGQMQDKGILTLLFCRRILEKAVWQAAFAIGVPRDIYAFHRYTTNSMYPHRIQVLQFQLIIRVEPIHLTADLKNHLRSL